jgi:transposase
VKPGSVIGQCMPRHRAQEFRKFLDEVERNVPAGFDIHVVMDNASSHKTQAIRNWFAKQPRWHQHFTPTSSSWLNQVERFFALLAEKQIKRGAHTSVKDLIKSIEAFIDRQNADPKPLRWTKVRRRHPGPIERFCRRTLDVHAPGG